MGKHLSFWKFTKQSARHATEEFFRPLVKPPSTMGSRPSTIVEKTIRFIVEVQLKKGGWKSLHNENFHTTFSSAERERAKYDPSFVYRIVKETITREVVG